MSSGGQAETQQATKDPWVGAQPALNQSLSSAMALYQNNLGYVPYSGQTQAALSPFESQGLGSLASIAQANLGGSPGVLAGQNLATNAINSQGITPGIAGALGGLGQIAGQDIAGTDPSLMAMLNTQGRQISDRINAGFSGAGRYGSGQNTDVLTRGLAESADPILYQDYARRMAQAQQIYGQQAGIYGQGLSQAGQFAQLAPTLDTAQYQPSQQLTQAGDFLTNRAQAQLNDQIKLYNAQQAWQWEQLARLNAIGGQAGALGGTQITATTPYQPPLGQQLLGGAIAGLGTLGKFASSGL